MKAYFVAQSYRVSEKCFCLLGNAKKNEEKCRFSHRFLIFYGKKRHTLEY